MGLKAGYFFFPFISTRDDYSGETGEEEAYHYTSTPQSHYSTHSVPWLAGAAVLLVYLSLQATQLVLGIIM